METTTTRGWRNVGERPLTEQEIGEIGLFQRKAYRRAVVFGLLTPLVFFVWIIGIAESSDKIRDIPVPLVATALLGSVLVMCSCFLWMRDNARRSAGLAKDLKRGTVVRYEGQLDEEECESGDEQRLFRDGLLWNHSAEQQTLEVLPNANAVWRVNGAAPAKLRFETEPIELTMADDAAQETVSGTVWEWIWFIIGWIWLASTISGSVELPGSAPVRFVLGAVIGLAGFIAIVGVHEGGHLLAGWLVGMRFVQCRIGPFAVMRTVGGLRISWIGLGSYNTGLAEMAARNNHSFRLRDSCMGAGGPIASLVLAIVLYLISAKLWLPFDGLARAGDALQFFAIVAAIHFVFSALPITEPDSDFANDGAQLCWLWTDLERLQLMETTSVLTSQIIDGQRPRDWPTNLLRGASRSPWSRPSPWGSLMLFYHHLDAGRPEQTKDVLAAGLAARDMPPLRLEMAFFAGLFQRDAITARAHLEAALDMKGEPDMKRAESAVLLAEGDVSGAREKAKIALTQLNRELGAGIAAAKEDWLRRILAECDSVRPGIEIPASRTHH